VTRHWLGRLALQLVLPVALVWLWWVTSADSTSYFYPPLSRVVDRLQDQWLFDKVPTDLVPSLARFTAGYLIAVVAGIALGVALGLMPRARRAAQPVTEFLRAVPPPLFLPFVIVTFGIGNTSKIAVIALGSVFVILLNTIDGVRGVDPQLLDTAASFRVPRHRQITHFVLPAASPQIAVGMRTGLAVGLIMMIISEMQGSTNGLGYQVLAAQRSFDTAGMFAGIIVIGVVGLVVNLGFIVAEGRIMRWYRGARGLLDDTAPEPRRGWPRRRIPPAGAEAPVAGPAPATGDHPDRDEPAWSAPFTAPAPEPPTVHLHPTEPR
jgi:ABC-type nitrate/sulfonate/bicarbonate transport system permease component